MGMKRRITEPGLGIGGLIEDAPASEKPRSTRDRAAHELLDEFAKRATVSTVPPRSQTRSGPPVEAPSIITEPPRNKPSKPVSKPPISRVSDPPPSQPRERIAERIDRVELRERSVERPERPVEKASQRGGASRKTMSRGASRPAIRVDDVGTSARKMTAPQVTPKINRGVNLKDVKIAPRDAFVLSLVDGKLDVPGLIDVAGLPASEVREILDRLERLGVVRLT